MNWVKVARITRRRAAQWQGLCSAFTRSRLRSGFFPYLRMTGLEELERDSTLLYKHPNSGDLRLAADQHARIVEALKTSEPEIVLADWWPLFSDTDAFFVYLMLDEDLRPF